MKAKFLYVEPKSLQARDRFENLMDSLHSCRIKEETPTQVHLSSITGRYSFWMDKEYDRNWASIK